MISLEELVDLVETWVGRLGLTHWAIETSLSDNPGGNPQAGAAINPSNNYLQARLEFSPEKMFAEHHDPEQVIVHELLHLMFRDLEEAEESVNSQLAPAAEFLYTDRLQHEREGLIDLLATLLVEICYSESG